MAVSVGDIESSLTINYGPEALEHFEAQLQSADAQLDRTAEVVSSFDQKMTTVTATMEESGNAFAGFAMISGDLQEPVNGVNNAFSGLLDTQGELKPVIDENANAFAGYATLVGDLQGPVEGVGNAFAGFLDKQGELKPVIQEQTSLFSRWGVELSDLGSKTEKWGEGIIDSIEHPLEFARGAIKGATEALGPMYVGLVAIATVAASVGKGLWEIGENAAHVGGEINDMGEKMSLSSEKTSKLKYAFDVAGSSIHNASNLISIMQMRMQNSPDAFEKGLKKINIDFDEFKKLEPDEQLYEISRAFQENTNSSNRAGVAMEIFSRTGRENIPILMKDLKGLAEQGEKLGHTISDEDAAAAEKFEMASASLGKELSNVATQFGLKLLPAMTEIVEVTHAIIIGFEKTITLFGALPYIWHGLTGALGENALKGEMAAYQQERINKALELGAPKGIDFGKAIEFINKKWEEGAGQGQHYNNIADEWVATQAKAIKAGEERARKEEELTNALAARGIVVGTGIEQDRTWEQQQKKNDKASDEARQKVEQWNKSIVDATISMNLSTFALNKYGAIDLPNVQSSLEGVDREIHTLASTTLPDFGISIYDIGQVSTTVFGDMRTNAQRLRDDLEKFFQHDMANIMMSAFTGGGKVGESLGAGFGKLLGEHLQSIIPETAGKLASFAGSFLGPLGTLAGSLIGKGIDKLFGLFGGGASEDELSGRKIVEQLERNVSASLNAQQRLEAGTDTWRQLIVGVRDEYAKLGLSEQQALDDVAAAWNSSKNGAEASAAAVQKIEDNLKRAAAAEGEVATASQVAADLRNKHAEEMKKHLDDLTARRDDLFSQIANEAPEEVMGVIESGVRSQLSVLDAQIEDQKTAMAADAQDMAESLAGAIGDIKPEPIGIPYYFYQDGPDLPSREGPEQTDSPTDHKKHEAMGGSGYSPGPMWFYTSGNEEWEFSGEGKKLDRDSGGGTSEAINALRGDMLGLPKAIKGAVRDAMQEARGAS